MTLEALEERPVDGGPDLEVVYRRVGHACVLSLRGALHAASVGVLESQFDRLGRSPCNQVVVDLRELGELDATGAKVLIGLSHYVHGRGGHLRVLGATSLVRDVLADAEARAR